MTMKKVVGGEAERVVASASETQFAQSLEVGDECVVNDDWQVGVCRVLKVVMDGDAEGCALDCALDGE